MDYRDWPDNAGHHHHSAGRRIAALELRAFQYVRGRWWRPGRNRVARSNPGNRFCLDAECSRPGSKEDLAGVSVRLDRAGHQLCHVRSSKRPEAGTRPTGFPVDRFPWRDHLNRYPAKPWPALFKTLLAYGYAARIPVAILMLFAIKGNWGTHYDVPPAADFPAMHWLAKWFWIGAIPQLVDWIAFTMMVGSLFGAIAVGVTKLIHRTRQEEDQKAAAVS